jgi:hypothetical protein
MRFVILTILFVLSVPAFAQDRIFRASPIDVEQNRRLDTLESQHSIFKADAEKRLRALESKVAEPASTSTDPVNANPADPVTGFVPVGPTVVMITNGNCRFCDAWMARYETSLRNQGWKVEPRQGEFAGVTKYPTFVVFDNKRWTRPFEGTMTMNDLRGLLGIPVVAESQQVVSKPLQYGRYSTEELRELINLKRPGGWRGPVYADVQPRSQAKQHLVGSEHGFSWDQVAGLTLEEALILHDLAPRHGNKIFPYKPGSAPMVEESNSGCARGDCAKQYAYRRFYRR